MELKILILKAGLTQDKLAKKLGTYQQKVASWINGSQPDYIYLPKLSEILGVTIEDVVNAVIEG